MKVVQSTLTLAALLISSHSVYGQWDPDNSVCDGCLEHGDTFQSCVKQFCKDDNENGDDKKYCLASPPYTSSTSLGGCCGFDNDCMETAPKVDDCTANCLPSCVEPSISRYLSCAERSNLSGSCAMEDCITKITLDRSWIDVGESSDGEDFFEKLGESLEEQSFSNDCQSTNDKGKEVCQIGASCCDSCNPKLGVVMNCIVNEMIRPWQKSEDTFGDSFDSSEDACSDFRAGTINNPGKEACATLLGTERQRQLTDMEETTDETEEVVSEKAMKSTEECMKGMKWNIALGNVTEAGSITMNCVVIEGARMLEIDEEGEPKASNEKEVEPKASSAAASPKTVLSAAFLVVAATSLFA